MTVVKVANTDEERQRIFQFRYSIYIEQQGKSYEADHKNRLLFDAADDDSAALLYTTDKNGNVVSTMRINWGYKHFIECDFMKLSFFQHCFSDDDVMFCSRLMTLPNYKTHVLKLFLEGYRMARKRGVIACFSHCDTKLIPFFKKLGFLTYGQSYYIEGVGEQQSLLLLDDKEHFAKISSPLLKISEEFESDKWKRLSDLKQISRILN